MNPLILHQTSSLQSGNKSDFYSAIRTHVSRTSWVYSDIPGECRDSKLRQFLLQPSQFTVHDHSHIKLEAKYHLQSIYHL